MYRQTNCAISMSLWHLSIRKFKTLLRRRRRQRRLKKMYLYFTYESRDTLKSFTLFLTVQAWSRNWIWDTAINFRQRRIWSFHVVVLQRTAKKCTKSYNAREEPLLCSLNLLFSDVPVAVAVVVILNSLILLAHYGHFTSMCTRDMRWEQNHNYHRQ